MAGRLGDFLLSEGLITREQLETALEIQGKEKSEIRQEFLKIITNNKIISLHELAVVLRSIGYESKILQKLAEDKKLDRKTYNEMKQNGANPFIEELVTRGISSLEDMVINYGLAEAVQSAIDKGNTPPNLLSQIKRIKKGKLLGEVLISQGFVNLVELDYILDRYKKRRRIGDMFIDAGLITEKKFNELLKRRGRSSVPIGEYLVRAGEIGEEDLLEVLSKQFNIPVISIDTTTLTSIERQTLRGIISLQYAKGHRILPVRLEGSNLTIALRDPRKIKDISHSVFGGFNVTYALMPSMDFRRAFKDLYGQDLETEGSLGLKQSDFAHLELNLDESPEEAMLSDSNAAVHDMEAHELVNKILADGLEMGASDIHVEQDTSGVSLRYRVDGVLVGNNEKWMSRKIQEKVSGIVSRIKIMSDLDISERRLPQDGAFRMTSIDKKTGEKVNLDFRVATCKAAVGENVVIRVLDSRKAGRSLGELNFDSEFRANFQKALSNPAGMILVTGPTGSGKSTTLYAALKHVHNQEIKIITAEDPIEYNFPGIMQTQIHPKIGLDFPRLLRSFLRLDPDVILVGEIRDHDTAQIAFDAAQTGHLLLSTLHTNDAFGALVRLRDLKIDYGQMAEAIKCVLAQRLVRKVCPYCAAEYKPDKAEWSTLFIEYPKEVRFFRGTGCDVCHFTGYKGRTLVAELFMVDQHIQSLIAKRTDMEIIRNAAFDRGMKTMVEDAVSKLDETNVFEIIRVMPGDLVDQFKMKQEHYGLHAAISDTGIRKVG